MTGREPPSAGRLWSAVAGLALLAGLAAAPGTWVRATNGARLTADEPHYLLTAISLVEDGDLDVADETAAERYRPFHELGLPPQAAAQPDGRMVVPHDPLLPALLAVPWAIGGWVGAKLALSALGGVLAGATVWVAVRRFGVRLGTASVTTGLLALSAPLAPYGTQVYPEVPAALATVVAVGALLGRPRARNATVFVIAVGALPWLAIKYVPVAATVAAVGLWRWWRQGARSLVASTAAAFVAAAMSYAAAHLAWYGGLTAYAAGDFFREHGGQLTVVGLRPNYLGRTRRLVGLLVDDEFGLGVWQPMWLFIVPAGAALLRRRPEAWSALAVPFAAGWLTATFVALTMQGWWFPGRQVVVVLPLAAIAIARLADRGRLWLTAMVGTGLVGVVSYAYLVVDGLAGRIRWVVDFAATGAPTYQLLAPLFVDYLDVTPRTWVAHSTWILLLGAVAWLTWRSTGPPHPAASAFRGSGR